VSDDTPKRPRLKNGYSVTGDEPTRESQRKRPHVPVAQRESIEDVPCACGCGEMLYPVDRWGRERRYLAGHHPLPKPPQKITPEVVARICARLAAFPPAPLAHACALEWVLERSLYEAMERDESIRLQIKSAQAQGAQQLAEYQIHLTEQGNRNWQSPQGLLDRLYPREYSPVKKVETSGPDGGPITQQTISWVLPANTRFPTPVALAAPEAPALPADTSIEAEVEEAEPLERPRKKKKRPRPEPEE
jgi:hypothetical protein